MYALFFPSSWRLSWWCCATGTGAIRLRKRMCRRSHFGLFFFRLRNLETAGNVCGASSTSSSSSSSIITTCITIIALCPCYRHGSVFVLPIRLAIPNIYLTAPAKDERSPFAIVRRCCVRCRPEKMRVISIDRPLAVSYEYEYEYWPLRLPFCLPSAEMGVKFQNS